MLSMLPRPWVLPAAVFSMLLLLVLTLLSLPERIPMHLLSVLDWACWGFCFVPLAPFKRGTDDPLPWPAAFLLAEEAEGTRTSAAILFSRFLFTGGPWLVPLCIRAERACCYFFAEALCSFLPEEPFLPLALDDALSGDVLFSKLTFSCSILFAIDDLSLYTILGVS